METQNAVWLLMEKSDGGDENLPTSPAVFLLDSTHKVTIQLKKNFKLAEMSQTAEDIKIDGCFTSYPSDRGHTVEKWAVSIYTDCVIYG
jgi:hypothetical protein